MRRQAKRRPMLNDPGLVDPRAPGTWGGPDPLPGRDYSAVVGADGEFCHWPPPPRVRQSAVSAWERLLATQPLLPGERVPPGDKRRAWFTTEMLQAGKEIGWVFVAVSGGLMTRSQLGEPTGGGPEADWSERLTIAYRDRYKPWASAMEAHQFLSGDPVHSLIIDLCVEDITVAEAERRNGVWRGKGLRLIEYGLGMYAAMAGWQRRDKTVVGGARR